MDYDALLAESCEAKEMGEDKPEYELDDVLEDAERLGAKCVLPMANQLQIDIDSEESFEHFNKVYNTFGNYSYDFANATIEVKESKSGLPHRHITITLPLGLDVMTRIAFQFALGSDPTRERLGIQRVLMGFTNPLAFFEYPKKEESREDNW